MKNLTDFCKTVETSVDPRLTRYDILKKIVKPGPTAPGRVEP